ncbi:MAG: DUF885 domain-containing protein [Flavobacteriaceae bacterium]|nr:DUF885 domain-containing protein [Flavobacteriaceae bacterium]
MKHFFCYISVLFFFFGCKTDKTNGYSSQLKKVIKAVEERKAYDENEFPLGLHTEEFFSQEADFAERQLRLLEEIDDRVLSETEQISKELLRFRLQEKVDHFTYKAYLNPILSDAGFHNSLAYMVRPIYTKKQGEAYLKKLQAMPTYIDQHIVLLRKGLEYGNSQPKVIFEGYESTYNDHLNKAVRDHFYFGPFLQLPEAWPQKYKDSLVYQAEIAIRDKVTPAFRAVKEFMEMEYLPKTRSSLGASHIPNGKAYYQNRITYYTTLDIDADSIHRIGLSEVARIRKAMEEIIDEVSFKGTFGDFLEYLRTDSQFYATSKEDLLAYARNLAKQIDGHLPRFFKRLPRQPYGVAPVPDAIAPKYTTGRYIGAPLESTDPGYYWVNTYDLPSRPLYVLPALTLHEAVPGHHLQISLNKELGDSIPMFRRNMYISAYGEGWGLYAEYLGAEMGMYKTPYERFGQLTYEMWRACRLVVDTGIHAKNWTREQVVDFMAENTALSMHEIHSETDRYISWPGQALSYKLGEIQIRELRKKAEHALGDAFDIREFHQIILEQGTVTLQLLDQRINNYITRTQNGKDKL